MQALGLHHILTKPRIKRGFILHIGVVVINLNSVKTLHRPIELFFHVRKKDIATAFLHDLYVFLSRGPLAAFDRGNRIDQKPFTLGSRNKQDPFTQSSPTVINEIAVAAGMVIQHYDVDPCFMGRAQQLRPGSSGVRRV